MSEREEEIRKAPTPVDELLLEFENTEQGTKSSKIKFFNLESGKDVYNITAPFRDGEHMYLAGRVESRDSEESEVIFFRQSGDGWTADERLPRLKLQDPCVVRIAGELVVGGVEIFPDEEKPGCLELPYGVLSRRQSVRVETLCKGTRSDEGHQALRAGGRNDPGDDKTAGRNRRQRKDRVYDHSHAGGA